MADSKTDVKGTSSGRTGQKVKKSDYQYQRRVSRISKENVFMVLAMWMEQSPLAEATAEKAGAVLVTEDNRLYAMDCTRDSVHAMARLLMRHSQKLKKSTIYTSRRPCSFCAKLLVQCGVRQLYYLPTKPENADDKEDLYRVDNLLKVSRLAHSYFVPNLDEKVAHKTEEWAKKIDKPGTLKLIKELQDDLMSLYWKEDWMKEAAKKLHWTACDDKMLPQFKIDFETIMKWISAVTVTARECHGFVQYCPTPKEEANGVLNTKDESFYRHLLAMAQILEQRTDDPKRGVGVVVSKENEIVATGWNGFPTKALYGEFPRASDKDKEAAQEQKKYPYVIHAEQTAFLMKNTADISGSVLFVTKVPCHECVPLLNLEKVTKCVIGITEQQAEDEFKRKGEGEGENLSYEVFSKEVKLGSFTCFVAKEANQTERRRSTRIAVKRRQELSHQNSSKNKRKKS